jgi:hypothetical protein
MEKLLNGFLILLRHKKAGEYQLTGFLVTFHYLLFINDFIVTIQ